MAWDTGSWIRPGQGRQYEASRTHPHRRILIVDDAEEARAILSIALGTIAGASVETTGNAEDAFR